MSKIIFIVATAILISNPLAVIAETTAEPLKPSVCDEVTNEVKRYACIKTVETFGEDQWKYIHDLVQRESSWNCNAQNPKSTAFNLFQFLNSTWKLVGYEKSSDCYVAIDAGIKYVYMVYNTPKQAIEFHNKNNWY